MTINAFHVKALIEQLAEVTDQSLDYYGFGRMCEAIPQDKISQKYLDDLYRNMRNKLHSGITLVRPSRHHLDIIASYLGFKNFEQFSISCQKKVPEILKACLGTWWSYVRANSGDFILRAPVKIYMDEQTQNIHMILHGNENKFQGSIELKGTCLFAYIKSGADKQFVITLKLGVSKNISVLKGVFCGISSSGIPIAGREVFIKETSNSFNGMKWQRFTIDDNRLDPAIRHYFSEHATNCLKISEPSFFDMNDLLN